MKLNLISTFSQCCGSGLGEIHIFIVSLDPDLRLRCGSDSTKERHNPNFSTFMHTNMKYFLNILIYYDFRS